MKNSILLAGFSHKVGRRQKTLEAIYLFKRIYLLESIKEISSDDLEFLLNLEE